MYSKVRNFLFYIFKKAASLLAGSGLSKLPGVRAVYHLLFRLFYPGKNIIEVEGSKVFVSIDGDAIMRDTFESYIMTQHWDEITTRKFKEVVKEGDVVLDLGANIGYYSLLASRLVGNQGRVYSFEPESRNYGLLLKNIEINGYQNIIPNQKAVSDRCGTIALSVSSKDSGAHTIRPASDSEEFTKTIEVEMVSLDEYFKDKEDVINVIKMDIEGSEPDALTGMKKILETNPEIKLFIEFYPHLIRQGNNSPEEFARTLMEDYGFSITITDDDWKDKNMFRIESTTELLKYAESKKIVNIFLERTK